jgi:hypothetical protein
MKRKFNNLILLSTLFIFGSSNIILAQDDKMVKEVQVVRPYEPSISDANKINIQPKIVDTIRVNPNFSYSIIQRPISTYFTPAPLSAARMVAEPLPDLSRSYVRLGIGNSILPQAEFYFASNRNSDYTYGAWLKYFNNKPKIKFDNSNEVKAPASNIDMLLFGKRMFNDKVLSGDIGYNQIKRTYYGYNFYNAALQPSNDKQAINRFAANFEFKSTIKDSSKFNYQAKANFYHLNDKYDLEENMLKGMLSVNKFIDKEQFGGDIMYIHYGRNNTNGSKNNTIIRIKPWAHFSGKQWHAFAGLNVIVDANGNVNETYFFPNAFISYDIVSHYIIPYVEINGDVEENSYYTLLLTNPWLYTSTESWNSVNKLMIGGGIKGKFSPVVSYNINANYSIIDSLALFRNISIDTNNPLFNRFGLVFDNIERTTIKGELALEPSKLFRMSISGEFYQYKTSKEAKPWHLPNYKIATSIEYILMSKLKINALIAAEGKRWAIDASSSPIHLDGFLDFNLGAEYLYNKKASIFINFNNITSTAYQIWYLYPSQKFNMVAGVSYKF